MTFLTTFFSVNDFLKRTTSRLLASGVGLSTLLLTALLTTACCYGADVFNTSLSPYYLWQISKDQLPKLGEMKVERPRKEKIEYVVNYPQNDSSFDRFSVSASSSTSRQGNSSSNPNKILDEMPPPPQGKVSAPRLMTSLQQIKGMSDLARNGKPVTLPPENPVKAPEQPKEGTVTNPDAPLLATQFIQDSLTKKWYAILTDQRTVEVKQVGDDVFYLIDPVSGTLKNRVVRQQEHYLDLAAQTPASKNNEDKKATAPDGHTAQQAVLLILAIGSVIAAFYVGFLAIDYKHRWEQEMAGMNQRFLGGEHQFVGLNSMEPDTLRFSNDLGGTTLLDQSADSLSDHPYRTIA
ncbi:MAG: hypothetical protein FWC50_16125 [Planctomycetaceae bacterium]|nr:hypothetical protein [Planctomycetaceae bacterium]